MKGFEFWGIEASPVLVSSMTGESIQNAKQKPDIFQAVGRSMPHDPAAIPDDPALPGLALLCCPEQLLAVLTPLLNGRLGSYRAGLKLNRLFIRRYVPGKRCGPNVPTVVLERRRHSRDAQSIQL